MPLRLLLGVEEFKRNKIMQPMFQELAKGQDPAAVMVGCYDSRVDLSLLTTSKPGNFFRVQNVGNNIPPVDTSSSESTAAAFEFALKNFSIKDIVVCGHADCGAMKGLLNPALGDSLPDVAWWLRHSQSIRDDILQNHSDLGYKQQLELATKKHILAQLKHLRSYPIVAAKIARGEIKLHGWYYQFEPAEVFIYHPESNDFIPHHEALTKEIKRTSETIARETAITYLSRFSSPTTADHYLAVLDLFSKLDNNDIPLWVWKEIREDVSQRLWSEIGQLYTTQNDPKFIDLVNQSCFTKLENLNALQKNIQESQGYYQYCGRAMRQSGLFNFKEARMFEQQNYAGLGMTYT